MSRLQDLAKKSEVARYMGVNPDEVERWTEDDGCPYLRTPGPNKPGLRFSLPDFHQWLLGYAKGQHTHLTDYTVFLQGFWAAQPERKSSALAEESC